ATDSRPLPDALRIFGEFGDTLGVTVSRGLLDLPADSGHLLETEAARGTVQNVADPACGREIARLHSVAELRCGPGAALEKIRHDLGKQRVDLHADRAVAHSRALGAAASWLAPEGARPARRGSNTSRRRWSVTGLLSTSVQPSRRACSVSASW